MSDLISRQAEQQGRVFKEIVVEYPLYNTYPEYDGKPYFSIKYTEDGQDFIGYGTYKPEVLSQYLKEYFMPSTQQETSILTVTVNPDSKEIERIARKIKDTPVMVLPSAEPEIVRCKNCVYYNWDCIDAPYGMTKMIRWCELHYDAGNENLEVNPTDFCKWAERKVDE